MAKQFPEHDHDSLGLTPPRPVAAPPSARLAAVAMPDPLIAAPPDAGRGDTAGEFNSRLARFAGVRTAVRDHGCAAANHADCSPHSGRSAKARSEFAGIIGSGGSPTQSGGEADSGPAPEGAWRDGGECRKPRAKRGKRRNLPEFPRFGRFPRGFRRAATRPRTAPRRGHAGRSVRASGWRDRPAFRPAPFTAFGSTRSAKRISCHRQVTAFSSRPKAGPR